MVKWHRLQQVQDYSDMLSLMQQQVADIIDQKTEEVIYSLEHKEVYTAGRLSKPNELLTRHSKIPIIDIGRGGKYTYHGPGQLVIYPILDLSKSSRTKDAKQYVKHLESIIIASLAKIGIDAYTIDGMVGVWVWHNNTHAKIAAIGIRIKKWVTFHGLCVNIKPDLSRYNAIIPCGIGEFPVTSLDRLGVSVSVTEFDEIIQNEFAKVFP